MAWMKKSSVSHTSQAGNIGGCAVSLEDSVSMLRDCIRDLIHSHKNFKGSMLPQLLCNSSIRVHDFWSSCFDILSPYQSVHLGAGMIHGVKRH